MSTGLTIVIVFFAAALVGWVWWKLFNTPDGERYLKMRTQGPFIPVSEDGGEEKSTDKAS